MALSKMERAFLIKAKQHIRAGKDAYICLALRRAVCDITGVDWHSLASMTPVERLVDYIDEAIRDGLPGRRSEWHTVTLECWQMSQGFNRSLSQTRQDRLAWIDWMLDQPE